jgi:hypothetical protein
MQRLRNDPDHIVDDTHKRFLKVYARIIAPAARIARIRSSATTRIVF